MTEHQKRIIKQLKPYIDTVNRTGVWRLPPDLYGQINDVYFQLHKRRLPSCSSCITNLMKQLYKDATN